MDGEANGSQETTQGAQDQAQAARSGFPTLEPHPTKARRSSTGAITYEFETKTFNYDYGIRLFADVMKAMG